MKKIRQKIVLTLFLIVAIAVSYFTLQQFFQPATLQKDLAALGLVGNKVQVDLLSSPAVAMAKTETGYEVSDNTHQNLQIEYADQTKNEAQDPALAKKDDFKIDFPSDYAKPIEVKLDEQRIIQITDANGQNFSDKTLVGKVDFSDKQNTSAQETNGDGYLKYSNGRKASYFAYQKDEAQSVRKLKHWTTYQNSNGTAEQESYVFQNAKLRAGENGEVEVYYFSDQDVKNEQAASQVPASLMERAQRTLQKEAGEDIMNGGKTPDFVVPEPYYLDKDGNKVVLKWEIDTQKNSINLNFSPDKKVYPIALDPTLSFNLSSQDNSIDGDGYGNSFGMTMATGDFNADGRIDLAVSDYTYSSNTGRAYIFYNDGSIPTTATTADVIITGEATYNYFGISMAAGDFNYDGTVDLAVADKGYPTIIGHAYVFYADGTNNFGTATCSGTPSACSVVNADVIITGAGTSWLGSAMVAGDLNDDGKTDLVVSEMYGSSYGKVYIFYNGAITTETAAGADVIISGSVSGNFGVAMTIDDLNSDGKKDLVVGSGGNFFTYVGNAYIFYGDGTNNFGTATCSGTPSACSAANADVIITGDASRINFAATMTTGDFNSDGTVDLAIGLYDFSSAIGRAYIFYNDGSIPTTATTADITIDGEKSGDYFGSTVTAGDFNDDGKTDLAIGSGTKTYIFYNDGSIPTTAATADISIALNASYVLIRSIIIGDLNADGMSDLIIGVQGKISIYYSPIAQNNVSFINGQGNGVGNAMVAGDFNADGKTDLAASSTAGYIYIFYNNNSLSSSVALADVTIAGTGSFGFAMTAGDFNGDGKTDLVASDSGYSSNTGRVYIFYNDGSIPTTPATADVIITGEAINNLFGKKLTAGDFNDDGKVDLAVGAEGYSSSSGRAYIFYSDGTNNFGTATCSGAPSACVAVDADVKITGSTGDQFGYSIIAGDLNSDGVTDLVVARRNSRGSICIFYGDNSIPTTAASADVIVAGENTYNAIGYAMAIGDFNVDGKTDLAAAAGYWATGNGRVYIFYNDGSIPTAAASADVIITGTELANPSSMTTGDFNADGKTDLTVGATEFSTSIPRAFIFYNDGSIPTTAATADVIITGKISSQFGYSMVAGDFNQDNKTDLVVGTSSILYVFYSQNGMLNTNFSIAGESSSSFGIAMTAGDFNADGKVDLAVGASGYSSTAGRAYIFYNNSDIPINNSIASSADVAITGESASYFGASMASGDFDADGKTDLAVGAHDYSSSTGRAYIFYGGNSIPTTAVTANVIITGEIISKFGNSMTTGDFNADGKIDLAVGAWGYSTWTGRAYIFYGGNSIPTTAATANVIITGEASSEFGTSMTSGDFNTDGKTDLAVGAWYPVSIGHTYIFYGGNSIPTTAVTADVIIAGENVSDYFGQSMTSGDFNADGKTDLAVGAWGYSTDIGRAYIFYGGNSIPTTAATANVIITGEVMYDEFGASMTAGDFNADGKTDLAVSAKGCFSDTGRAYILYNDGTIPTTAVTADIAIAGDVAGDYFGHAMVTGDFNADMRDDLAIGGYNQSSGAGKIYIYIAAERITPPTGDLRVKGTMKFKGVRIK